MKFSKIWRCASVLMFLVPIMSIEFIAQAQAHAFEVRYDLPIPLWLYLLAAGLTVALSFLIFSIGQKKPVHPQSKMSIKLPLLLQKILVQPILICSVKLVSMIIFISVVISAAYGPQFAGVNFSSIFIWVIWWSGMAYIIALLGNVWPVINPWNNLYESVEKLCQWVGIEKQLSLNLPFPSWLEKWPSTLFLLIFIWLELVYPARDTPLTLASLILTYSALTWLGMWLFGREFWLSNGEVFTQVFDLFGKFSPIYTTHVQGQVNMHVRHYALGLARSEVVNKAQTTFILILLASLTFDGFSATPLWSEIRSWFYFNMASGFGVNGLILTDSLGVLLAIIGFSSLYFTTCWLMSLLVSIKMRAMEIAKRFALSLIPIALAYHLAHYFTYLLIQGQNIVPLLSDPVGRGWNLFGTIGYTPDTEIVSAGLVWAIAISSVVIGHIAAVWLAHNEVYKVFNSKKDAWRSQIPMVVLMVAYTMSSLWILAQPVVDRSGG